MTKLVANWNYPTAVRFGAGRISELPDALPAAGIKRPLFVTDPGLAKLPIVAHDAEDPRRRRGCRTALFSDVKPNPVESNLDRRHRGLQARAGMTASSPSAAARRSISAS